MKISDEARGLTEALYERLTGGKWNKYDGDIDASLIQSALTAARNQALEDAAVVLDTKVVNVNGTTDGKSGVLKDDPFGGMQRDAVRGTYADAIRAMKVKP